MVLDTTACQRAKVKATSVCRGPDRGQKVSVRVRTTGDPKSAITVHFPVDYAQQALCLHLFVAGGQSDCNI